MKRRNFLKIAGIGTVLAIGVPGLALFKDSTKDTAVDLILKEYHFLKISREEAERYVNDYIQENSVYNSLPSKVKLKTHLYLNISTERSNKLLDGFLPATDFFLNKMDESKELKYIGLYNPHKRPCSNNPFSYLFYPDSNKVANAS